MLDRARGIQDQMVGWRREIHMHPELGFQEARISALVEEVLGSLECWVRTGSASGGRAGRLWPSFDLDEGCLPVGAAILAEAALRFLWRNANG